MRNIWGVWGKDWEHAIRPQRLEILHADECYETGECKQNCTDLAPYPVALDTEEKET